MKYSCIFGWTDIFNTGFFKSAIFDECQELRRNQSEKYSAAKCITRNVEYTLGLSATPIYNYGNEIFNVVDVIYEGALGDRDSFYREWCTWRGNDRWIVNDPKALGSYLREQKVFVRRTRAEVGRELPPVNKIIYEVGYDQSEVDKAEKIATQLAITATTGSFIERGSASRELNAYLRHITGVSKAVHVAEFVKIFLENKRPVLLAGWHRDVYDIWLRELAEYNPVMYTGSESIAQKEEAKRKFIAGETDCFIISLRSGIGLDGLQHRCDDVVIGEPDWSPQVHEQLIGRVARDGSFSNKNAYFMVSDFGSDPIIMDALGIKSEQSHNIINPMEAVADQHTDLSNLKFLAEEYLKKKHLYQ